MDSLDNFRERLEALERRTQMVEQRWRWWRSIACGVIVLALLSLALPSGKAADAPGRGMAERMAILEDKLAAMAFDTAANEVVITGANLRIVNGLGNTRTTNGLGNLIVGYNEERGADDNRTGSHNVVVGMRHNFSRFGGLVVGDRNTISGDFASVSGGGFNAASGDSASVTGGGSNTASGTDSSVSGGNNNNASGEASSVSGGIANVASGPGLGSTVSGGQNNRANGEASSVSGGVFNLAGDPAGQVAGGEHTGPAVSGGNNNNASGGASSVSGGENITVNVRNGWAAGSFGGTISGRFVSP